MKPTHFAWKELVPSEYVKHAEILIDDRLIITLEQLRDKFGPVIVNTDTQLYRGWRPYSWLEQQRKAGVKVAELSQHFFGRAADCNFTRATVQEVRKYVIDHPFEFPHIKGIDDGVSWFHFDLRNADKLTVFKP